MRGRKEGRRREGEGREGRREGGRGRRKGGRVGREAGQSCGLTLASHTQSTFLWHASLARVISIQQISSYIA
jgi:hypothetical protein